MRNLKNDGFALIEACLCLLCVVLSVMLIQTAIKTYVHISQLPDQTVEEEELKEIYES